MLARTSVKAESNTANSALLPHEERRVRTFTPSAAPGPFCTRKCKLSLSLLFCSLANSGVWSTCYRRRGDSWDQKAVLDHAPSSCVNTLKREFLGGDLRIGFRWKEGQDPRILRIEPADQAPRRSGVELG